MGGKALILPDLQTLNECFDVDYNNGILIWKARPISHFVNAIVQKRINAKFVGKKAGSITGKDGYLKVKIFGINYPVHRIIYYMYHNTINTNLEIDHINHDKLDNKISNIRLVTSTVNNHNKLSNKRNSSGTKGVYWHKVNKKWNASISNNDKQIFLGQFTEYKDAVKARKKAEILYNYNVVN